MAHRSRKKHLKHMHAHEPATPPAKSPVAKAEAATRGIAKQAGTRRVASDATAAPKKRTGLVRRIADKATETLADVAHLPAKIVEKLPRGKKLAAKLRPSKLAAKPKKVLSRAKARIKSRVSRGKSTPAPAS